MTEELKRQYSKNRQENGITEYFEEVEIRKEYDGYYYSIGEAITIVIIGSVYGLKSVSQIHQLAKKISEFFEEEILNRTSTLLLLIALFDETDKTRIAKPTHLARSYFYKYLLYVKFYVII